MFYGLLVVSWAAHGQNVGSPWAAQIIALVECRFEVLWVAHQVSLTGDPSMEEVQDTCTMGIPRKTNDGMDGTRFFCRCFTMCPP